MSVLIQTSSLLKDLASRHETALVSFSGGKDSLVVLSLARRAFRRVVCFNYTFVPDLELTKTLVSEPLGKLGIPCFYYTDPKAIEALRTGTLCDQTPAHDKLKAITNRQLCDRAMLESGCPFFLTGKKESDFPRRGMRMRRGLEYGTHPLAKWRLADVKSYMKFHGITPPSSCGDAGGIDLSNVSLIWLHDNHQSDYQKILKYFPYAEAARIRAVRLKRANDEAHELQLRVRASLKDQKLALQPKKNQRRSAPKTQEQHSEQRVDNPDRLEPANG